MAVDLSKLIIQSQYNTFKNNNVYYGTFTISGTTSPGTNLKTFSVPLNFIPDMVDIIYNDGSSADWFKQDYITVLGNGGPYVNYPTRWTVNGSLSGSTLVIQAIWPQEFTTALTLTPVIGKYRLVDYSAL